MTTVFNSMRALDGGTAFTPTLTNTVTDRLQFFGTGLTNWNGWASTGTWAVSAEL